MKKIILSILLTILLLPLYSQDIQEIEYQVGNGLPYQYDNPGTILYPVGYNNYNNATPVIFVHGIIGKLSGSYEANIEQVMNYGLKAAFVQLEPVGNTVDNGMLLSRMIDKVTAHYQCATVSIVAHSRGGIDTERALYYLNPYDTGIPSFSYEKVDGVYTLSSPLRGARVADIGASLSWFSGLVWATMWYTNGWSMTSGSINSFHNWAQSWMITSNGTFKNYYNPGGASYTRRNMTEDNTTRWWAHQSDDECYQNLWYFCYVGRPFHHSVGAWYDAYWEWDWFDSGWRNWHAESDGFISEYRAKRSIITNAYPQLTPNAGDANWRTMQDANHTSLWDPGENHLSNEIAPYLHQGLYYTYSPAQQTPVFHQEEKQPVDARSTSIMGSNGAIYFSGDSNTQIIVENDGAIESFLLYAENPVSQIELSHSGILQQPVIIKATAYETEPLSGASISIFKAYDLHKGVYTLSASAKNFMLLQYHENPETAFALNYHFDEQEGYRGNTWEAKLDHTEHNIDPSHVKITAHLTKISPDGQELIPADKTKTEEYQFTYNPSKKTFELNLGSLDEGAVYSVKVDAFAKTGTTLLSRSIAHTFYVHEDLPVKNIIAKSQPQNIPDGNSTGYLNLYPVPSHGTLNVDAGNSLIDEIIVTDDKGNTINHYTPSATRFRVILPEKGWYFIKIIQGKETSVRKIFVE